MGDGLEVTVGKSNGGVEVAVGGEIDIATVDRFRRALRDAVFETEATVNVDLLEVRFIGSVGINALVGARQLALDEGVAFRIVKASRNVEHVLDLMGLTGYFD
jgi:stage II sporulation protein AA (anti-sigma F factor antagonist)